MENDANPNPALIQPMDQNIIQNIKLRYRKLLLTTFLNDPLHNENLEKTQTNWAAEADDSLAPNKILTDNEIIRTVTAEDDDGGGDVTPVNPIKISHSEAGAALNTSLQWAEEQNFEAPKIMLLRRLRDRAFQLKIGMAVQRKITDFFGH
ncbi:hypothetical protein AVEN_155145-1 [Araneus ventricosus]|uniref:Uncharacterized protein n=1 Tax=Araneus ventricosus TaxID=182803 RepID=A0A4Y2WC55_ARAVE|nr:hypothetical protein AVEN_21532-1 [Araneus ventricosus]GBO34236.1 hypothetical protein AVEN_155145-1 [Araneus ventricosus]